MGQGTQVFIQTKDLDGNIRNYFYHQQWGYGKGLMNRLIMLCTKLNMLNSTHVFDKPFDMKDVFGEDSELFQELKDCNIELGKYENEMVPSIVLYEGLECQDNNDGYMIVKLESNEFKYSFDHIQVGFYTNELDYINFVDYLKSCGEDKDYINYAKAFVKSFISAEDSLFVDVLADWDKDILQK